MGVDISGRKPKTEAGDYFCSNWWGWRPIHAISEAAMLNSKLDYDSSNWGSNDGKGLRTQKQCDKLADAIELLIFNNWNEYLIEDDDRIYICLGSWCEAFAGIIERSNQIDEIEKNPQDSTFQKETNKVIVRIDIASLFTLGIFDDFAE